MIRISSLVYATGNQIKFEVAAQVMAETGIVLTQDTLDVPEIQSYHVEEVAEYSAIWASQKLSQPVAVTDAGYYVEALKGFPGPFIKYVNEWFSAEDFLKLMYGKANRSVILRECLAFCQPKEEPVLFCRIHRGKLALKRGQRNGTTMDQIFIPAGCSVPVSDMPADEMIAYWRKASIWKELVQYLVEEK